MSVEDELLARTATLGDEHEQRHLDVLRAQADGDVAVIGRPAYTVEGLTAAAQQTTRAVDARAPADLPGRDVRRPVRRVRRFPDPRRRAATGCGDTKLARSAKVEALLQLAAYADALAEAGVPVAAEAELVLGNGR